MKLFYLPILLFLFLFLIAFANTDPIDHVASLLKQDNVHGLSALFAPSIELTVMNQENFYSSTQAELVLDKFFSTNRPKNVRLMHKINSNPNYLFGVLVLTTNNGVTYRIAVTLNDAGGVMKIIELRIEEGKN